MKKLLKSGTLQISARFTYKNVIEDYSKAHDLKENIEAVVEAILLAVDNGTYCILALRCTIKMNNYHCFFNWLCLYIYIYKE